LWLQPINEEIMDTFSNMRKLPRGIQSFEKIRKEGCVYVDKTDLIWHLANDNVYKFLSRPRRFGKSLLTSTLKCYFEGKRELFDGLKISSIEKNWTKHYVFMFDFSGCTTPKEFYNYLDGRIREYEKELGKSDKVELKDRFFDVMKAAYERTGETVAVLVDEYDAPLHSTMLKDDEHENMAEIYRSFFPIFKTGADYLKCLFLTGITKFTQLSLFSVLNNVAIISAEPMYASICGITRQEIADNFMPELETMAKKNNWTVEQTLEELKSAYDGYHFSNDLSQEVYNPYSLIEALSTCRISNYWVSSGDTKMLTDMLIHGYNANEEFEGYLLDADMLELADVSRNNVPLLLYQSGYLTIKGYDDGIYTLGFPNREVKKALYNAVLPNVLSKESEEVDKSINRIRMALRKDDIEGVMKNLKSLISETPYARKGEKSLEERFRSS